MEWWSWGIAARQHFEASQVPIRIEGSTSTKKSWYTFPTTRKIIGSYIYTKAANSAITIFFQSLDRARNTSRATLDASYHLSCRRTAKIFRNTVPMPSHDFKASYTITHCIQRFFRLLRLGLYNLLNFWHLKNPNHTKNLPTPHNHQASILH